MPLGMHNTFQRTQRLIRFRIGLTDPAPPPGISASSRRSATAAKRSLVEPIFDAGVAEVGDARHGRPRGVWRSEQVARPGWQRDSQQAHASTTSRLRRIASVSKARRSARRNPLIGVALRAKRRQTHLFHLRRWAKSRAFDAGPVLPRCWQLVPMAHRKIIGVQTVWQPVQ